MYLSICTCVYIPIHLFIYSSIDRSIYLSTHSSIHPSNHPLVYPSIYLLIYLSIQPSHSLAIPVIQTLKRAAMRRVMTAGRTMRSLLRVITFYWYCVITQKLRSVICHKSIDCNLSQTILFVTSYKIEIKGL